MWVMAQSGSAAKLFITEFPQCCTPVLVSRDPDRIRALPGVGSYTAAAIGSLAFNHDMAVLDGNVIRVLARLFAYVTDSRSATAKRELQELSDLLMVLIRRELISELIFL